MLIDADRMISVARLQKELTRKLHDVAERGEELFVLRNNELAAVIMTAAEYAVLKDARETLEHLEIAGVVRERMKGHDRKRNVPWDKVRKAHGLHG
ncbi:MAG: hypothetical protein HY897_06155 [Deltaproteobacteria bacterium]|nr:hypothetical protein [Deltaproteobacteria bacterium]